MEISFRFNEGDGRGPVTIHVPAGAGGFTINVNPVAGPIPSGGGVEPLIAKTANPIVFFDMTVDGKPAGQIVMELFADTTPRTAENFRALCTGEKGMGKMGKPLHYKGSIIDDIVPGVVFAGGDFIAAGDGSGGESIYENRYFEDENFVNKHTRPGSLFMYNDGGPDTNESQFGISMRKESWSVGNKYVMFGQVVEGLDVINSIMDQVKTPSNSMPLVVIADCGQIS